MPAQAAPAEAEPDSPLTNMWGSLAKPAAAPAAGGIKIAQSAASVKLGQPGFNRSVSMPEGDTTSAELWDSPRAAEPAPAPSAPLPKVSAAPVQAKGTLSMGGLSAAPSAGGTGFLKKPAKKSSMGARRMGGATKLSVGASKLSMGDKGMGGFDEAPSPKKAADDSPKLGGGMLSMASVTLAVPAAAAAPAPKPAVKLGGFAAKPAAKPAAKL